MNDIEKHLGIAPIETFEGEIIEPRSKTHTSTEEENDYKYARTNFYNVIEKGTDALEQMLDVAKASEHPRAYEVVSTLIKTLIDANKDLVSLGETKRKESIPKDEDKKITNNLFVGSTAELQQLLKDMKNE